MVLKFGIDVSHYQGNFDFKRAKSNHSVEFAILKIAGGDCGLYKDPKFDRNYSECKKIGMPIGCYFFSEATTMDKAKKEVDYWIGLMNGKQFEYPVFLDVEGGMLRIGRRELTDICKYMLNRLEKAGYWAGIYSSDYYFNTEVYDNELSKYSHWVASWGRNKPSLQSANATQMWQFGGDTNVLRGNSICGVVCDQDFCYIDYPAKIKAKGLNGFSKTSKSENTTTKPTSEPVKKPSTETKPESTETKAPTYKCGDHITFVRCYVSSVDTGIPAIEASRMSRNHGTITMINENTHPYLLDNGLCWVAPEDISGYYIAPKDTKINVGDKVKIKEGATYSNGAAIPKWVMASKLYVRSIRPNNKDYILSTVKSGPITGVINVKDITKV